MSADRAKILIIDDAQSSLTFLGSMVESLGHQPVLARSGLEGLRMLREHAPSLVLLDVVMPDLDGFKVAAAIKATPGFVPLVMLTGLEDLDSKRRGHAAGADDFITKPVSAVELQIRIAAMLRIKALTDELAAANRRLVELADTDPLTGFGNRRSFEGHEARELERARRYRRPLSILVADLDHFKRVNDTWGHPTGDMVLKGVACALLGQLRGTDHIARMGGEEFAVIAPETPLTGAFTFAERLRRTVERLAIPTQSRLDPPLKVTISIGVAAWDGHGNVLGERLYKLADDALYRAKRDGRNRVVSSALSSASMPRMPALKLAR